MPPRMKRITEEEAMAQVKADMDKMRVRSPDEQPAPAVPPAGPSVGTVPAPSRPKAPEKQRLLPLNFIVMEYGYSKYVAKLTKDQTLQDALDPSFWGHIAEKFKPDAANGRKGLRRGDIVRLWQTSTGLRGEVTIMEASAGRIIVDLDWVVRPEEVEIPADSPLQLRWMERRDGEGVWEVVRKTDVGLAPLASGFQMKAAAARWIVQHIAAMAA